MLVTFSKLRVCKDARLMLSRKLSVWMKVSSTLLGICGTSLRIYPDCHILWIWSSSQVVDACSKIPSLLRM